MPQKLMKQLIRKQVWTTKKKTVVQVLTRRCRRDGEPVFGGFTTRYIERIIQHTNSNIVELMPYLRNLHNFSNYEMLYSSLVDLAIFKALLEEKVDPDYATNLIGEIYWQFVLNTAGNFRLKMKLIALETKDPMERMGMFLSDKLKFSLQ